MKLKDLPEWPKLLALAGTGAALKSARPSQLGHFVILEIEQQGAADMRMVQVGAHRIQRVLKLLVGQLGKSLHEIGELELDD